jgi:ATP-dependent exoDNAse (exonuclease V) alpha subunit
MTQRLAATRLEPLPATAAATEIDHVDHELGADGKRLSDEQRAAIELACGEHPLVVIEGQAGTGKSTTLTGVARAHQACGRNVIVTSTAALAAERLAGELAEHGVDCTGYSTAGLQAAISVGRFRLTASSTVIHDEAALASTGEQLELLRAVEASGARLVAVGDPQQNRPVGASGLWTRIRTTTHDGGTHVQLTVNKRARDVADRRDQARFREGQIELALRGYAARHRIHIDQDQLRGEDMALDAAHRDASHGKSTIVIAQTSNDHLDQLNARAQAIRDQHGELGKDWLEIPRRPYRLHAGDVVQIRRTITHPNNGQLRNGTTATVTQIDSDARWLELQLADHRRLRLDERQIDDADLRLAYVQHPFPAQGRTTDTAHVIVAAHATREGSYVAVTRARHNTHIYATQSEESPADADQIRQLAERISHTEPDIPSIDVPTNHEAAITALTQHSRPQEGAGRDQSEMTSSQIHEPSTYPNDRENDTRSVERGEAHSVGAWTSNAELIPPLEQERTERRREQKMVGALARDWPGRAQREVAIEESEVDRLKRDRSLGWEP